MDTPVVSICCISYNQEKFIRATLDGFLMQKTDFPYEIVISDDCSTDGTRRIIEEYKAKYPELVRDVSPESNMGVSKNLLHVQRSSRGKYIAFCEGDDYWTDPYKLQKQVDFLESHPEYSTTFHRCKHINAQTGETEMDNCAPLFMDGKDGADIDLTMFFTHWYTQPLTMVFRADCAEMEKMDEYIYYRDMHLIYHLLKNGKGRIFSYIGGVRTIHSGGVASQRTPKQQSRDALAIAKELYEINADVYTRDYYCQILQWAIDNWKRFSYGKFELSWKEFTLNKDFKRFLKNLKR